MKIKKFIANSMPEAMKQIKAELGTDAIILNSKEIKPSGLFGLFRRKKIEVTAMLDVDAIKKSPSSKKINSEPVRPVISSNEKVNEQKILEEIKYLQSVLANQSAQSEQQFPPLLENVYQYLLEQEVNKEIAKDIVSKIQNVENKDELNRETIAKLLREEIETNFTTLSINGIHEQTKVIQFVGPTGVGKTTTIAKVAANSLLKDKKSVAFITADTYRIAAIEQLKTYAKILDVPLEVIYSTEDYENALQKFINYDRIFVDTAGRNFRQEHFVSELKQLITTPKVPTQTFLVLALTAKAKDIFDIYAQFKPLGIEQVIFTKLDETETYGSLLNLAVKEKIEISYITNGQNVPDDLLIPNEKILSDLLLRRYQNV
jgi:flagellar biosynthesis protein FlhF